MLWIEQFSVQDVKLLASETKYKGYLTLKQLQLQHRLFDGGFSSTIYREVIDRANAVGVLPYDPVTDQVVLIEQFRTAAFAHQSSPWILEIIAGAIDPEESLEVAACRETKEECGCEVIKLIPIAEVFMDPASVNQKFYFYCGIINAPQPGSLHGVKAEGEDIRVHVMAADEGFALVKAGKINNAISVIALQWLQLNRNSLKFLDKTVTL